MGLAEKFKDVIRGERRTLLEAIEKDDYIKVQKILSTNKAAADIDIHNKHTGYTEKPIHIAARAGAHDALVMLLLSGAKADVPDTGGRTALMFAAHMGHISSVTLLLDKGADLSAVDNSGFSPLYHACHAYNDTMVKLLMERGADANGPTGSTPPVMAVSGGRHQLTMLKMLLAKGADPNRQDRNGRSPLDECLSEPNHGGVSALLDYGAKPSGRTGAALIWSAAVVKNDALVDRLLAVGADPEVPMDDKGTDVLEIARPFATPATNEKLRLHVLAAKNARNVVAVEKEMAAGSTAAISVKPIKLKLST